MLTTELKSFTLNINEYKSIKTSVPTSIMSELVGMGVVEDPYYADNIESIKALYPFTVSLGFELQVNTMLLSHKYLYLELPELDHAATVLVNGVPVANLGSPDVCYLIDIRALARFGKNTVELRFEPLFTNESDYLTDLALIEAPRILAFNYAAVDNVVVGAGEITPASAELELSLSLLGDGSSVRAVATLTSPSGSISFTSFTDGKGSMSVSRPSLWWPGDLGPHGLYRLTVNLYHESEVVDTYETTVGIRDFAIASKDDKRFLTLGGSRFYPLGAVHIPEDHIRPRITPARINDLLDMASKAGINTLYLKDCDRLPRKSLLNAADRLGICIWITLPKPEKARTEAEVRVIREETRRIFRRLSCHPSITLVIGDEYYRDMAAELLPGAVFLTSLTEIAPFGIPSLPSLSTCRKFCPDDELNFLSPVIEKRCTSHLINLLSDVLDGYRMPHSFEEFIYLTEVISARHAEKRAIKERFRDGSFGSVIDRLSDSVPKPSSSAVDYYKRPKALWYFTKRFYRSTIVKADVDGTRVKFVVSNLDGKAYSGKLVYAICDNDGSEIFRDTVAITVARDSIETVYECDLADMVVGRERKVCLFYGISDGIGTDYSSVYFFTSPRYFEFKKPNITVDITGTGREYVLTVSSDKLASMIALDFGDEEVILDDNFFDLVTGTPRQMKLYTPHATAVETLRRTLTVKSLYDVGRFD